MDYPRNLEVQNNKIRTSPVFLFGIGLYSVLRTTKPLVPTRQESQNERLVEKFHFATPFIVWLSHSRQRLNNLNDATSSPPTVRLVTARTLHLSRLFAPVPASMSSPGNLRSGRCRTLNL